MEGLISKVQEEEERYAKAYGAGTLDFEQFKDLMRDAKKREQHLQDQLNKLSANSSGDEGLDKIQVDDICQEATRVLKEEIDDSDKARSVKMLLDKVTIKEGGWVNVCGHIPLFTQRLGYEPASRNGQSGNQHFVFPEVSGPRIPYELVIDLPKPRYERNVVERDRLGRIVRSKPPQPMI